MDTTGRYGHGLRFDDFYEDVLNQAEISGDPHVPDPDILYESMSDEYEFFQQWLDRPDDESHISLDHFNEMKCIEIYG